MVISAEDGGGLTAPVNARVNVSVVGGSVVSPVFDQAQYFFTVSEDVLRGTAVGVVRAATKTGEDACTLKSSLSLCSTIHYFSAFSRARHAFINLLDMVCQGEPVLCVFLYLVSSF